MIRLFKYEFLRITSLRSSWVLTILGTLMVAGIGFLALDTFGSVARPTGFEFSSLIPAFVPVWTVWAATLASQAFGHDYRHGTIRLTLSTFPNRLAVYFVRVMTVLIWCAIWLAVTILIVNAEIAAFTYQPAPLSDSYAAIGKMVAFNALFILTSMFIVLITRVLALGVVIPLMMASVVENIVALMMPEKFKWSIEYFPYSNAMSWAMPWNEGGTQSITPLVVLTAALFVISLVMFKKRDA
ncbi:MAG: hypothetical protein RLZZ330_958 [Actinomycetota bacterium]|jgi:ABC-type transport system involved in multi-copper enzyme maturation permease subunit